MQNAMVFTRDRHLWLAGNVEGYTNEREQYILFVYVKINALYALFSITEFGYSLITVKIRTTVSTGKRLNVQPRI